MKTKNTSFSLFKYTVICISFTSMLVSCFHKKPLQVHHPKKAQCGCKDISLSLTPCDTTHVDESTKMYWQWNCDSSWYSLETKKNDLLVLDVLKKERMGKTKSIGIQFVKPLNEMLWFRKQEETGCCYPPTHLFLDLKSGEELFRISKNLFIYEDIDKNYLIYFKDKSFNTIVFHQLLSSIKTEVSLPPHRISYTLQHGNIPFPKELFDRPTETTQHLQISYQFQQKDSADTWFNEQVTLPKRP